LLLPDRPEEFPELPEEDDRDGLLTELPLRAGEPDEPEFPADELSGLLTAFPPRSEFPDEVLLLLPELSLLGDEELLPLPEEAPLSFVVVVEEFRAGFWEEPVLLSFLITLTGRDFDGAFSFRF
jgi:hypothetical protein